MVSSRDSHGQATVEFAFSLILLTVMFLLLLQVGLVARDQVLVTQAAREGARTAAVDPDSGAAVAAAMQATALDSSRLKVDVGDRLNSSGMVTVVAQYQSQIVLPLANSVLLRPTLEGKAAMYVE